MSVGRVLPLAPMIALGLVVALGAVLGYREIASPDLGFHLGTARWIVEHAALPDTDPFTYTVSDHSYIDLQWLFQLLIYGLHRLGSTALIGAGTTGLTLGFGALLLVRARRRAGRLPLSSVVLLLVFFLGNHWEPRPHLLSWLWGSLVLLVLEEHARGSRRGLPCLPLVMLLWVNTHSLFVLGLVIIGAYVACGLRRPDRIDRSLVAWAVVAFLACLINPYHVNGLLFPFTQFRDIQGAAGFKSPFTGIAEFTSPFSLAGYFAEGRFVLFQPRLCWPLYTGLALAGLIASRKRAGLPEWVLWAGFLYVFWRANKNFGYFVMVSFPLAAAGLDALGERLAAGFRRKGARSGPSGERPGGRLAFLGGVATACLGLIVVAWTGRLYDLAWTPHHRGTGFNRSLLPVEACAFINRNRIQGRILNSWDQGGFIAWTTRQKVFIYSHGEVVGPEFYREYVEAKRPEGFARALRKWKPTVAIVPFADVPFWLFHLHQAKAWRMVHADEHTAIFLHASVAPEVRALPRPLPGIDFPTYENSIAARLIRRAAAAPPPSLGQWLEGRRAWPIREMMQSAFYLHAGEWNACFGVSLKGVERTPFLVPELMLNLGHALNARRLYKWADLCFDTFLRVDPDPVIARGIQEARRSRR
jgi:hypothetical protein